MITANSNPAAHAAQGSVPRMGEIAGARETAEQHLDKVHAIRRTQLSALISIRADGSVTKFAAEMGYTRSRMHQYLSPTYNQGRSIGEYAARKLEERANLSYGWLDQTAGGAA